MMQRSPIASITQQHRREIDGVEIDVIFSHELVKFDVIGVEPPFLPFGGVVGGDTGVAQGCIELDGGIVQ